MDGSISVTGLETMRSFGTKIVLVDVSGDPAAETIAGSLRGDPVDVASWATGLDADAFIVVFTPESGSEVEAVLVRLRAERRTARYLIGGARAHARHFAAAS